jgi:hypothetical protein
MSDQTWTKEPWWRRVSADGEMFIVAAGPKGDVEIATVHMDAEYDDNLPVVENAARLTACVNYCAGIPTDVLTTPSPPEDGLREAVDLKALAAEIADDLFTAGNNVKAGRLVLEPMDKRGDLGGWIESAVKLVIERHLAAALGGKE